MRRRTFIRALGPGVPAVVAGFGRSSTAADSDPVAKFEEKFGVAVAEFFDDDWGMDELAEHVSESVDFICFAYGTLDDDEEVEAESDEERGFLSKFDKYSVERLVESDDFLNWFQENLEKITEFLDAFDVLADRTVEVFEEAIARVESAAKYAPIVGSLKGLLDTGCSLHSDLEKDGEASREDYIRFFKNATLVAVEIVLLATGLGGSYRVAYGVTGWVNRRLISAVGQSIGWSAYSLVLSQIHWGIRVAYSEVSGLVIEETIREVTEQVIDDAAREGTELSRKEIESDVREHVEQVALKASDGPEKWRLKAELFVDDLLSD